MKKNNELSAKTLLIIAVITFILRFLIGGIIGSSFGLVSFICLIFGLMRLYRERKQKEKTKPNNIPSHESNQDKLIIPKTDEKNFISTPHIAKVVEYFIINEKQMSLLESECLVSLFNNGYSPLIADEDFNNPKKIEEIDNTATINTPKKWLIARLWLDLINFKDISQKTNTPLNKIIFDYLELLGEQNNKTLITAGLIAKEYEVCDLDDKWESEINKIKNKSKKENYKINYVNDTLFSAEMRVLAWFYKELFNKEFEFKK
ncbi:MAG: hypothetical protein M0Q94_09010 [Candidatus Cloacimonetes bacterium]|nr:hypothetical protein [Candidatus Cloacimonadota bacterium]